MRYNPPLGASSQKGGQSKRRKNAKDVVPSEQHAASHRKKGVCRLYKYRIEKAPECGRNLKKDMHMVKRGIHNGPQELRIPMTSMFCCFSRRSNDRGRRY